MKRLAASKCGVAHLRGLIWSRTGHGPKAKNNNQPDCELTKEAIEACKASALTKCPPAADEEVEFQEQDQDSANEYALDAQMPEGGGEEDAEMAEGEEQAGEEMEE